MLDFRFYTFLTLCETLNYTKAAQHLCLTQPAVSQHIRYLEEHYNCKLFHHIGKEIHLTQQGERLQESVRCMAADEKHALARLHMQENMIDTFSFGATLTIGEYVLPKALSMYIQETKQMHLHMLVNNTSTLLNMLYKGEIQFAFVEGYFKKQDLIHKTLSKQRFIAIRHHDYPLHNENPTLEELLHEPLLLREHGSGTRDILERLLHEHNMQTDDFQTTLEIGNINAIKCLVKQNSGITFLYEAAVREELKRFEFIEIPLHHIKIEREFSFITLKDSMYIKDYLAFFERILQILDDQEHM